MKATTLAPKTVNLPELGSARSATIRAKRFKPNHPKKQDALVKLNYNIIDESMVDMLSDQQKFGYLTHKITTTDEIKSLKDLETKMDSLRLSSQNRELTRV